MVVTEYRGLRQVNSARVKDYPFSEFVAKISKPVVMVGTTRARFDALPKSSDNYDDETRQSIKEKAGGVVFGEATEIGRKAVNFPYRSALAFDYEHCTDEIFNRLKNGLNGFVYCWHTTCTNNPPEDVRLHIIVPFEYPADWKLYSVVAVEFARKIGLEGLDLSSLRRSQMLLYCVKLRDSEYRYGVNWDGKFLNVESYLKEKYDTLDVDKITEEAKIDWAEYHLLEMLVKKKHKVSGKIHTMKGEVINVKEYDFTPHKSRAYDVKSCFNAVFSCRDILDSLTEYIWEGDRYTYYKALHNKGGVWISADGTECGSFHANSGDPLFGRKFTAFDVWVLFHTEEKDKYVDKLKKAHEFAMAKSDKYKKLFYKIGW